MSWLCQGSLLLEVRLRLEAPGAYHIYYRGAILVGIPIRLSVRSRRKSLESIGHEFVEAANRAFRDEVAEQ